MTTSNHESKTEPPTPLTPPRLESMADVFRLTRLYVREELEWAGITDCDLDELPKDLLTELYTNLEDNDALLTKQSVKAYYDALIVALCAIRQWPTLPEEAQGLDRLFTRWINELPLPRTMLDAPGAVCIPRAILDDPFTRSINIWHESDGNWCACVYRPEQRETWRGVTGEWTVVREAVRAEHGGLGQAMEDHLRHLEALQDVKMPSLSEQIAPTPFDLDQLKLDSLTLTKTI